MEPSYIPFINNIRHSEKEVNAFKVNTMQLNIEQIRLYCLKKRAVTEEFPFNPDTLVFKVLNKMFVLIALDKWEQGEPAINLKCDPEYALELRAEYDCITSGYHMNNKHWNTINLSSGEIPPKLLFELIDHSYDMVVKGLTKKMRDNLTDN